MKTVGELPPAPKHSWQNLNEDLNNHRADGLGLVSMPEMEQYLNGLLYKIKTTTGTTDWPGAVHITAETSLNASSSAAGNIYISLGWLQSVESEDEIFAILSHEYGHIYLNHYAVYDVKNAGDSSALIAGVTWSFVNRNISDHGWNGLGQDSRRSDHRHNRSHGPRGSGILEEQADLFGATVSLRWGYSYIHGFKAFLERIDTYDRRGQRAGRAVARGSEQCHARTDSQGDARFDSKGHLPPPAVASDAAAPLQALASINDALSKLNAALADGQVSLKQKTFDATQGIDSAIADGAAAIRDTHPEGAAREGRP